MTVENDIKAAAPPISFDTHHDDVIHDAKVDFYGRKLATASSDRTVRIFQINDNQTETLLSILSGHEGPVWQIAWAHPKFGSILASCSYDGTVVIWREDAKKSSSSAGVTNAEIHSSWSKIKIHKFHKSSVNSIAFAPHVYGLSLACASSDGMVSILTKSDSTAVDSEEWVIQEFEAHPAGCNSISWCPSSVPSSLLELDFNALDNAPVPIGSKVIATGGCDNSVKLWKVSEDEDTAGKWILQDTLEGHTDWVRDVCWRPNLGQVGHLLASSSQDNTVRLWRCDKETSKWSSKLLKPDPFPDTLWRVSFSEYGHLLAVSCGDNTVTIWSECPENGIWELVGNVDEKISDTLKIEEPLAVAPPEIAPEPKIDFSDRFMKPNSITDPIVPVTSPNVQAAGYQQSSDSYEAYAEVPAVDLPILSSEFQDNCTISHTEFMDQGVHAQPSENTHQYIENMAQQSTEVNESINSYVHPADTDFSTVNYGQGTNFNDEYSYTANEGEAYTEAAANNTNESTYDNNAAYDESYYNEPAYISESVYYSEPDSSNNNYDPNTVDYSPTYNYSELDPSTASNGAYSDNSYGPIPSSANAQNQTVNEGFASDVTQDFNKDIGFISESYELGTNTNEAANQQLYPPNSEDVEEEITNQYSDILQYEGYQGTNVSNNDGTQL